MKKYCERCKKEFDSDYPDPCIGYLPGVKFACCGHGEEDGYILFENGMIIHGDFNQIYVNKFHAWLYKFPDIKVCEKFTILRKAPDNSEMYHIIVNNGKMKIHNGRIRRFKEAKT